MCCEDMELLCPLLVRPWWNQDSVSQQTAGVVQDRFHTIDKTWRGFGLHG